MSDAKDVRISRETYAPHPLANIVNDLWGHAAPANAAGSTATQAVPAQIFPPFEQLWQVADETVDWTEALVREHPADGLTSETLWQFFHENAQAVLDGDIQAYMTVLKAANPLGDLKPYARDYTVRATDADELTCDFEVDPAYLSSSEGEAQRYLCGVSLRVARDLMALLPETCAGNEAQPGSAASADNIREAVMKKIENCIECGACEPRCPYELPIREMMKRAAEEFGE